MNGVIAAFFSSGIGPGEYRDSGGRWSMSSTTSPWYRRASQQVPEMRSKAARAAVRRSSGRASSSPSFFNAGTSFPAAGPSRPGVSHGVPQEHDVGLAELRCEQLDELRRAPLDGADRAVSKA